MSPPLKIHGGKHYMADAIIKRIPPHIHYVEPFFGGGSVLLNKPVDLIDGHSEVVNDINFNLYCFWMVLQTPQWFEKMRRELETIPFSQYTWETRELSKSDSSRVSLYRTGVSFFIRCRMSRQGLGEDFATLSRNRTRRGMNEQVSAWLSAVEGLPQWHERLKRVVILNDNALNVIKQQDGPNTFFYLDPPYLLSTRASKGEYGEFEMSDRAHAVLLAMLSQSQHNLYDQARFESLSGEMGWDDYVAALRRPFRGRFILSGYPSEMYDEFARENNWRGEDILIDNKASSKKNKPKKTERLWMNFTPLG